MDIGFKAIINAINFNDYVLSNFIHITKCDSVQRHRYEGQGNTSLIKLLGIVASSYIF